MWAWVRVLCDFFRAGAGCLWFLRQVLLRCQEQWAESPEGGNPGVSLASDLQAASPRVSNLQKITLGPYGPLAKNQANGMEPIVTTFLEGELELTIS